MRICIHNHIGRTMVHPFFVTHPHDFPEYHPKYHRKDGLIALTDNLSPPMLLVGYQHGAFPWFEQDGLFYWFATHPRTIFLPQQLHIGRSLKKLLRQHSYIISVNQAFKQVIAHCATVSRHGKYSTWISDEHQFEYTKLYYLNHAHSVECWQINNGQRQLVGGIYGVQIGRVFYGESMFSLQPSASKIALATAIPHFARCGIELIDCQQASPHIMQLGAIQIPFHQFRKQLCQLNPLPLLMPLTTEQII